MFTPAPPKARALPRALRLAAQGARGRRRAQPARAARRHRAGRRRPRRRVSSTPAIAIRTGDTPQSERARFQREPADILITTPESLYLLLTSNAREALRSIDTIIIDEIHALVPTKRGAHLALSLERLEALCARPPQRIGLSATQRPLDEVARFLGGADVASPQSQARQARSRGRARRAAARRRRRPTPRSSDEFAMPRGAVHYRPVTIVDAGEKKALKLTIEVPVEDMAKARRPPDDIPERPGRQRASRGRRSGRRFTRGCSS